MFSNVLIGVDGRQGGRDAIALAMQLAAASARITLAHVYSTGRTIGRGAVLALPFEREDSERLLEAEKAAARIDAELVPWPDIPPARGVHELAERLGADLLVVGSSRHAGLGRVPVGDQTRATLNGAPCAIAVAVRGYAQAPHSFAELGIGYDGSSESEYALSAAREIADRWGASIRALWVVSPQNVRDQKPVPADWPAAPTRLLEECQGRLRALGDVDGEATYGDPREALARFSEKLDLLVTGSRGYGAIGRLFHGSISTYFARHAACPLLVLPRVAMNTTEDIAQARAPIGARA